MKSITTWLGKNTNVLLLFLGIGLLVYLNVLGGSFVFDDELLITRNQLIRSLESLPDFFNSSISSGAFVNGGNFFRPIQLFIYSIIYQLFKLEPLPYHFVSVLIHSFNGYLIFQLLRKLKIKAIPSLIAALFYFLHPVHTQAVSYISGIADPLGLMFSLGSLLMVFKYQKEDKPKYFFWSVGLFVLAVLSKESYFVTAPLAVVFGFISTKDLKFKQIKNQKLLFTLCAIAVIYVALKLTVFNFTGAVGLVNESSVYTDNPFIRLSSFVGAIPEYLKLIFFPLHLFYEKHLLVSTTVMSVSGVIGLVTIVGLITGSLWAYSKKEKLLLAGLLWIIISFLPFIGLIPLNAIYLEHWLYMPMGGVAIIIGWSLGKIGFPKNTGWLIYPIVAILGLFVVRIHLRNAQWADPVLFYENEIEHGAASARVYNNLANEYSIRGELDEAIDLYTQSLELRQDYPQTHHNLAYIQIRNGFVNEALDNFYKALTLDTGFIYSHIELSKYFERTGDIEKAKSFKLFAERIGQDGEVTLAEINKALGKTD
ncbi:MAG: tetratricopeptide repeat protein [Candidatus Dojkabacteria bacterium]